MVRQLNMQLRQVWGESNISDQWKKCGFIIQHTICTHPGNVHSQTTVEGNISTDEWTFSYISENKPPTAKDMFLRNICDGFVLQVFEYFLMHMYLISVLSTRLSGIARSLQILSLTERPWRLDANCWILFSVNHKVWKIEWRKLFQQPKELTGWYFTLSVYFLNIYWGKVVLDLSGGFKGGLKEVLVPVVLRSRWSTNVSCMRRELSFGF